MIDLRLVRTRAAVGVCLGLLSFAPAASAEVIDFRGSGRASAVSITVLDGATTLFNGSVMAGELRWAWLGGTPAGFATDLYTYCIDATQYLMDPQTVAIRSTSALVAGATHAGAKVAWLFNTYAGAIRAGGTNVQAAALQVAIWEALYDTNQDFGTGAFRMSTTGAIRTQAQAYLTALSTSDYSGSTAAWLDVDGTNADPRLRGQDQIAHSIPEPATLLLMGLGGLLVLRRRSARLA